jgi:hypothetical protein
MERAALGSVRGSKLEDAQRALSANLADGIALSHRLMAFVGAARKN